MLQRYCKLLPVPIETSPTDSNPNMSIEIIEIELIEIISRPNRNI